MRKTYVLLSGICICLWLFLCVCWGKGVLLHQRYPDPPIQTYAYGETAQVGGYEITFSGWKWDDVSWIRNTFPDYQLPYMQMDGRDAENRVGIIEFQIKKVEESTAFFDVSDIAFSIGAWGNQFDMELFYRLNPDLKTMAIDLPIGETQKVVLPLIMFEFQFAEEKWKEIDSREIYIDLQYYPEHIRFVTNDCK